MKNAFILLLSMLTISSQAISFTWKSDAQVSFGDSLVSDLTPATYTATLVYLGTSGSWGDITISAAGLTLAETNIKTGDTTTSQSGLTGLRARQNSTFTGTFDHAIGSETSGGYTVAAGDTFGVFLSYTDSAGKSWYNVSSGTFTIPTTATDITTGLSGSFSFASTKTEASTGSKVSAGSGWVAVPEPSTAALALAGLALLLKRRKA